MNPYIEKINFDEFKQLPFGKKEFPQVAIEIFKDLTLFNIQEDLCDEGFDDHRKTREVDRLTYKLAALFEENRRICKKLMRTFKALAANKHQELPTEAMLYLTK
jgi:hypothetical protein